MLDYNKKGIYEKFLKRPLDFFCAITALIFLCPLLVISAILVRFKLGSPILFRQARPGKNEKIFYLLKFRSMTNSVCKDGKLLPDTERLTKFGKILRKTSLDELPELINIVKGDMSIVGPRPLSIYYLPHYNRISKNRHNVRPGLTGLAQVSGRNNLLWDDRFSLDVRYVNNITLFGDVKIIIDTFFKVIKATDISVRGTKTMYDFGTFKKIQEEGNSELCIYDTSFSEIGSYFWLDKEKISSVVKKPAFLPLVSDSEFTFSGRAAIEIVLRDLLKKKKIKKVYVPSYCCVSMLQSFIDNGIDYEFYEVSLENGKVKYEIDSNRTYDMFLFMRYFSMKSNDLYAAISDMKKKGTVILEDITHSLLDDKAFCAQSDYLVASLRKWFAVPTGGWIGKVQGKLEVKPNIDSNHIINEKIDGMNMKYQYLSGKDIRKDEYLKINSKFDNDLIHVDRMLKIDDTSIKILGALDINWIKKQRRNNARVLRELLSDIDIITLPDIDLTQSTPLFFPVFLETEDRDSLQSFLINKGMFCPVHWPEVMGASLGVRDNELSLICDQRYSEKDMNALSSCIHDWLNRKRGLL